MNKQFNKAPSTLALAASAIFIASCGGGGGDETSTTPVESSYVTWTGSAFGESIMDETADYFKVRVSDQAVVNSKSKKILSDLKIVTSTSGFVPPYYGGSNEAAKILNGTKVIGTLRMIEASPYGKIVAMYCPDLSSQLDIVLSASNTSWSISNCPTVGAVSGTMTGLDGTSSGSGNGGSADGSGSTGGNDDGSTTPPDTTKKCVGNTVEKNHPDWQNQLVLWPYRLNQSQLSASYSGMADSAKNETFSSMAASQGGAEKAIAATNRMVADFETQMAAALNFAKNTTSSSSKLPPTVDTTCFSTSMLSRPSEYCANTAIYWSFRDTVVMLKYAKEGLECLQAAGG